MFGVRILIFVVAYVVVIGEMVVGAMASGPTQKIIWILPGGLVIALLFAVSIFLLARNDDGQRSNPNIFQWLILLIAGMGISASAFYFPGYGLPFLLERT